MLVFSIFRHTEKQPLRCKVFLGTKPQQLGGAGIALHIYPLSSKGHTTKTSVCLIKIHKSHLE